LKLKRILAGILAVSTVLTATACNGNTDSGTSSNSVPETTTETTIDDEIDNPVDIGNISVDAGEKVEPATLMYMGNYDIRTAGDVKPAYKYFQENYDCDIEVTIVNYLQILEKLTAAISSGESPDLVDYQDNVFPLMMSKNLYTPLEDVMDLSAPQWSGLESYINKFKWNGHNYYYPWSYDVSPYFLIYNRGLFEEIGIDDPKELYESGDWDWTTFKECCQKFVDSQDGRLGLYGAGQYSATSFIDSTGTPLLTIEDDGKLVCNLVNADVERATTFMSDLYKEGLAGFAENVNFVGKNSGLELKINETLKSEAEEGYTSAALATGSNSTLTGVDIQAKNIEGVNAAGLLGSGENIDVDNATVLVTGRVSGTTGAAP
jgi:multiple sugar transport system substrate-binding protein